MKHLYGNNRDTMMSESIKFANVITFILTILQQILLKLALTS